MAGVNLTDALEQTLHGVDVLEKFPVVAILSGAGTSNMQKQTHENGAFTHFHTITAK